VAASAFWKGKFYHGLRIVDVTGQAHEVVSANVRRPRSPFGQWLASVFNARVSVETETRLLGPMSVAEVVHRVEAAIDAEPESFEEFSGSAAAAAKTALGKCTSVRDIVSLLARWRDNG
jgi:hypothetical protein